MNFLNIGYVVAILFTLTACGGSSGSSKDESGIKDIVGVWDFTSTDDELTDEAYFHISSDGAYTIYDYLGDSFDDIEDCYAEFANIGTITHLGGSDFLIVPVGEFDTDSVNMSLINGQLSIEGQIIPKSTLSLSEIVSNLCSDEVFF